MSLTPTTSPSKTQTGTSLPTSDNLSIPKVIETLQFKFEEKVTVSPRKSSAPSSTLTSRNEPIKKLKRDEVPPKLRSFPSPFPSPFLEAKPDLSNNSEKQPSSEFKLKRDWEGSRTPEMRPPKAPRKMNKSEETSPFKLKYDELIKGSLQYNNETYKLSFLGKGNYSVVFSMEKTGLTGSKENIRRIVAKGYHGEYRTGFDKFSLNGYLKSSISYYHTIKKLGLPVAEILNAETASTDLFIIQQHIANPVNFSDPKQLEQVKKFFDAFCQRGVVMDLQPENFREENGSVYLIDFLEEEEKARVRVTTSLKAWANLFWKEGVSRPEAEKMLTYLGQAFIDSGKYINANSIQEFLDN